VAAALVTVLVVQGRNDPGPVRNGTANEPAGDSTSGTFTQQSPWRLRIKDAISEVSGGDDVGCDVMLTNEDSGNVRDWDDFYGTQSFQMRESGTFRYEVSDPGCLLLPQQGDGGVSPLPFTWPAFNGDTPVFESPGAVTVRVENRHGTPTCDLWLMSDSDGRPLDNREAAESQKSVRLESNGPGRVYIAAPTCSVQVSAAP
jgi:hypothetical protein